MLELVNETGAGAVLVPGWDLAGKDLAGAKFYRANLTSANLAGATDDTTVDSRQAAAQDGLFPRR
jgi:hypothetical protein